MKGEFYTTRDLFKNFIDFDEPLSYREWLSVDDSYKVAVLYLQFFDQITLAWYKVSNGHATEEEGVETILQYLNKNVEKLKENPRRFTANYIYRVAYNCLYCISYDRKCFRWERENVRSANVVDKNGDEICLFNFIADRSAYKPFEESVRNQFWAEVDDLGEDTASLIENLLEGTRMPAGLGGKAKREELMEKLRPILEKYKAIYYN